MYFTALLVLALDAVFLLVQLVHPGEEKDRTQQSQKHESENDGMTLDITWRISVHMCAYDGEVLA